MKVITIQQPWASLIMIGAKSIETRSWATKYRGQILIHASAGFPKANREFCQTPIVRAYLREFNELPLGVILGQARLRHVYPSEHLLSSFDFNPAAYNPNEREFGDYSQGRYGWMLDQVGVFDNPIPAKGQLGLWNFPDELLPK